MEIALVILVVAIVFVARTFIGRPRNHATLTPPTMSASRDTMRTASHTGARPTIASVT